MIGEIQEFSLSQFKKPSSQMTSGGLKKIFKQSEIRQSHFFPKEVPSLLIKKTPTKNSSTSTCQKKEQDMNPKEGCLTAGKE